MTDSGIAHEDKVQSRAALLPNVNFTSQAFYTQPKIRQLPTDPRFIAGNGVHEYIAQGNVHEALPWKTWAACVTRKLLSQ